MSGFFPNSFPKVGDLTYSKITEITGVGGVKCSLLEYNNIEAFIPLSDISKRRINNAQLNAKIGKLYVVSILNVDSKRGFVDATKKGIDHDESVEFIKGYTLRKKVIGIISRACDVSGYDIEAAMSCLWDYIDITDYLLLQDLFVGLCLGSTRCTDIFRYYPDDFPGVFTDLVKHKFKVSSVTVSKEVVLKSLNGDVDDLKKVALSIKGLGLSFVSVAPPCYRLSITGYDRSVCSEKIEQAYKILRIESQRNNCFCDHVRTENCGDTM